MNPSSLPSGKRPTGRLHHHSCHTLYSFLRGPNTLLPFPIILILDNHLLLLKQLLQAQCHLYQLKNRQVMISLLNHTNLQAINTKGHPEPHTTHLSTEAGSCHQFWWKTAAPVNPTTACQQVRDLWAVCTTTVTTHWNLFLQDSFCQPTKLTSNPP